MEICRLCLLSHNQHINVFTDYGPDENIAAIISKHVGEVSAQVVEWFTFWLNESIISKVCESDPLPKFVCLDCWKYIDSFHEFHEKVHAAQDNYLRELIKCEQENNFVTIPEPPVHVIIDASITDAIDEDAIKIEYDDCKNAPPSPNLISCEVDIDVDMKSQDDVDTLEEETEASEIHSFEHSEEIGT